MKLRLRLIAAQCLLLGALLLSGCFPSSRGQSEEEKEPYFLAGKSRVSAMDYKGAIESFEKALEVNPHSGAAHFQLGWLFDRKANDPAAAIFHYERYLRLRPNAPDAEVIKQQILACKQELARTVSLGPLTEKQQRDLEKTLEENKRLIEENKRLNDELTRLRVSAAAQYSTNPVLSGASAPRTAQTSVNPSTSSRSTANPPPSVRTHTVKPGETPAGIAKKYGIKVETLLAANPRLEPRRMRAGQTIVIP